MRGKADRTGTSPLRGRITPAYAGKRKAIDVVASRCEDHPRLCGEKQSTDREAHQMTGSPPPMRGKAEVDWLELGGNRITPAYAGKSPTVFTAVSAVSGSPPPMRGKAHHRITGIVRVGITPAYAGKRSGSCTEPSARRDHPRLCGEKR